METNKRERRRYAQGTGRVAPRLQAIPGPRHSRVGGNLLDAPRLRESGNLPHAPAYGQAGTYPNAARPDRSTLSRRVRGVLSPYRERGSGRLRACGRGASRPVSKPSRGHVIPAKAGTYRMRLAYAKAGTYPMPPQLHNDRHSGVGRNPEGAGASPASPDPADVPLDRFFIRF